MGLSDAFENAVGKLIDTVFGEQPSYISRDSRSRLLSPTKKMPIGSSRKMPPMKVQAPPTTVFPVQNNTNENSESSKSTELQEYRQHQELQQQELERRITEEEWALEKDSHSFQQRMFEKKLDNDFTLSMADKQLQNKESERRHEERMYELDNEARRLENERMRIENDRMIIEENIQRSQNVNNSFFRGNDNDMM